MFLWTRKSDFWKLLDIPQMTLSYASLLLIGGWVPSSKVSPDLLSGENADSSRPNSVISSSHLSQNLSVVSILFSNSMQKMKIIIWSNDYFSLKDFPFKNIDLY